MKRTGNDETRKIVNKAQPIFVGFMQQIEKTKVFQHLKNLKGLDEWDKVFIADDYTDQQRNERELLALAAYAWNTG